MPEMKTYKPSTRDKRAYVKRNVHQLDAPQDDYHGYIVVIL